LGLPKEYIDLATQRMAAINAAYDQLRELRQAR
jgi:DnaJ-domain-containing protein 1